MRGVVFTELIDHLSAEHTEAFAQQVIDAARLPSKGAYTAVGSYPNAEFASIIAVLSEKTGVSTGELHQRFGRQLFMRFSEIYPVLFEGVEDAFDFLAAVETRIHVEVKKLYSNAEFPNFEMIERTDARCRMIYRSTRHMEYFCTGLIEGCLAYFGEPAVVSCKVLAREPATIAEFTIERVRS